MKAIKGIIIFLLAVEIGFITVVLSLNGVHYNKELLQGKEVIAETVFTKKEKLLMRAVKSVYIQENTCIILRVTPMNLKLKWAISFTGIIPVRIGTVMNICSLIQKKVHGDIIMSLKVTFILFPQNSALH